jgi:hypothetical protein
MSKTEAEKLRLIRGRGNGYDPQKFHDWKYAKGYISPCAICGKPLRMAGKKFITVDGHRKLACLLCRQKIVRDRRGVKCLKI